MTGGWVMRLVVSILVLAWWITPPAAAQDVVRLLTLPDDRPMPVSLTTDGKTLFVADYLEVSEIAGGDGPKKLSPVFPEGMSRIWHPTGVYSFNGKLYVANYVGKNILVGVVRDGKFFIEQEIKGGGLVSPENVAANESGVAVADYDASRILFFDHVGRLVWSVPSINAHGVFISGGYVYASSLSGDGVQKITIKDGAVVATSPRTRWVYPTAVIAPPPGSPATAIVIDANAKKVVALDSDLRIVEVVEPSGPIFPSRFYGALAIGERFLLTDTESGRLLWLGRDGRTEIATVFSERKEIGTSEYAGGVRCSTNSVDVKELLPGRQLRTGFSVLCGDAGDVILPRRSSTLPHRPAQPFGFVWSSAVALDSGPVTVMGSANRSIYMVIQSSEYTFVGGSRTVGILGPKGAESEIRSIAVRGVERLARRKQCAPLAGFLRDAGATATFPDALKGALGSTAAKAIVGRWLTGSVVTMSDVQRVEAEPQLWLEDAVIVRMLPSVDAATAASSFDECTIAK